MSKISDQQIVDKFDEATLRADVNIRHAQDALPILNAVREEEQHAINLVDSLVDKWLDLAKLLIAISVPALVTLYSLNKDSFNSTLYMFLTAIVLVIGVAIFVISIRYKLKYIPTHIRASTLRLGTYGEWVKTVDLRARNEDLSLDYKKMTRK